MRVLNGSALPGDPGMYVRLLFGNLEISLPLLARQASSRTAKARMHGREKSDSPIVPARPANKAVQAAAELVEARGGSKGNAELQNTVRTQSRAAMSHAQNRIREAVERNKQEKLTALLHYVKIDFLRAAFLALRKRAGAGVDAVTWEHYAEALEGKI